MLVHWNAIDVTCVKVRDPGQTLSLMMFNADDSPGQTM